MSTVTPVEHTAIGALAGVLEVSFMQPTVAIKNALQEGRALPKTPAGFYRGYTVNAASIAPITAIQFGANRFYEITAKRLTGRDSGQLGQIGIALAAGSTSASVSGPAELIMIQQQRNARPLMTEARAYIGKHGLLGLYRGIGPTFIREGLYTGGYLGICPVLVKALEGHPSLEGYPSGTPTAIAGITAGLLAVFTTQPFDTIKTRMQAFVIPEETPEYRSSITTMQHLVKQGGGWTALWSGIAPRAFRIVGATFILNGTKTYIVDKVERSRTS